MGGTTHRASVTEDYLNYHASAGTSAFTHSANITSGSVAASVHPLLDPKGKNKAGIVIRESRDSDAYPITRAVSVLFDQTGSMQANPGLFKYKLTKLIAAITKKGYLAGPQVMFGAIGDAANREAAPLQIGQFESGNEMDSALFNIYLEGNGGGSGEESYELAAYFLAKYAEMDCLSKRGEKGYLFIVGDERPYPVVEPSLVESYIGDKLAGPILFSERDPRAAQMKANGATGDMLAELEEKFEVFWIMPSNSMHWNDPEVENILRALFGERFMKLDAPENITETIVAAIGINEGYDLNDVKMTLKAVGATDAAIRSATSAVGHYTGSAVVKGAKITGKLPQSKKEDLVALT